jgi:dihydrofolate reductase
MRKVVLYIAMSLDGKIADVNGETGWLEQIPNPDANDYGYAALLERVDTTIMGRTTYQQVCDFPIPFPYSGKRNFVITRDESLTEDENATFISIDFAKKIAELKREDGGDIWLIGGAEVNTLIHNHGLIDEYMVFVMPIVLGEGVPLFAASPKRTDPRLIHSETFASGVVLLTYERMR